MISIDQHADLLIKRFDEEIEANGKQASNSIPERPEVSAEYASMVSEDIASNRT